MKNAPIVRLTVFVLLYADCYFNLWYPFIFIDNLTLSLLLWNKLKWRKVRWVSRRRTENQSACKQITWMRDTVGL